MVTTSDIKNGLCLEQNGKLFTVVQFLHVKPGKGAAFVRTKLKNLENGKVIEHTYPAGAKINDVRIERRPYQYLYKDDTGFIFMNNETFDQIPIAEELISTPELLKEGQEVEIIFHAEKELPIDCELPPFVTLEVTYTEPGLKGDTASSSASKPAELETGASISVPLFIETGDIIKVDTRDVSYSERAK